MKPCLELLGLMLLLSVCACSRSGTRDRGPSAATSTTWRPTAGNLSAASAGVVPIVAPGTTYYVNARSGKDEFDGLTPLTALRTLAHAVTMLSKAGGDKLVMEGSFDEPLTLKSFNNPPGGSPDPTRPTVVQCAFDHAGKPLPAGIAGAASFPFDKRGLGPGFGPGTGGYLAQGISIVDSNYVTVSAVNVRGIIGPGVSSWRSSHVRLEHMEVSWTAESAMLLSKGAPTDPLVYDLVVQNCRINQANLGAWVNRSLGLGYNMRPEAVSIVSFVGFSVQGNHLSNSLMEGIDFKVGSSNGTIQNNIVENTRSAGIYANEGLTTVIRQNIVRHIGYYDPQDGTGVQLATAYMAPKYSAAVTASGASGILISNGDLGPGLESGRVSGIFVSENTISWTLKAAVSVTNRWRTAGRSGWLVDGIHVYNNVAYRNCQGTNPGLAAVVADVGVTNSTFTNNIVTDSLQSGIEIFQASSGSFFATNVISHNLFHANAFNGHVGASPQFGDPLFVLAPVVVGALASFEVFPGSPAIDAGLNLILTGGTQTDIGAYQTDVPPWSAGLGSGL